MGYLELFVKDKSDIKRKENLIYEWYYEKATLYFFNILQEFNKIVKQDIKSVKIRQMKTRWGSCNSYKSYINLNIELIKKPKACIEYVVFHELAHLFYNVKMKNLESVFARSDNTFCNIYGC